MRARFLLPALWLLMLPVPRLWAQGRPLGPWRLTYQTVTEGAIGDWGNGPTPGRKVVRLLPTAVPWNVASDSICLFRNCENPLIAPARPRKGQLPIRFTATGATVQLDTKKKRLFVVPSDSVVTLRAYRGQKLISKRKFSAIPPPLPLIEAWASNRSNDFYCFGPQPDSAFYYFELGVRARPSESFAAFNPSDARYRVSRFQLTLMRGTVVIRKAVMVNRFEAGIKIPRDSIQLGDRIRIDVQQVQRMNFRGVIERIPLQMTVFRALPL